MTSADVYRLPDEWGSALNRAHPFEFQFNGKSRLAYAGDTVSSALAANGLLLLSRSFKYHRPRGSYSFAGWDANGYVQIGDEPNVNADLRLVEPGLVVTPQNVLGTLDRDLAAITIWFKRFLTAGFYYRGFFRPQGAWRLWEPMFRRVAGLGRIATRSADEPYRDKEYLHTDVAIVGAGPAGLSAAIEAAERGAKVLLIEESPQLGGALNYALFGRTRAEVDAIRSQLITPVQKSDAIRVLLSATCQGCYADNWLAISHRQRLYKVRAKRVVLATGSVEQPAVFRNNDLPGIVAGSAVHRLLHVYGVRPGNKAVVITANADGLDVARSLVQSDIDVSAIVDISTGGVSEPSWNSLSIIRGYEPYEALLSPSEKRVTGLVLKRSNGNATKTLECDLIAISVGYAPLAQLCCHSGATLEYDDTLSAFKVSECPAGIDVTGSVNHCYSLDAVLADGRAAGRFAAERADGQSDIAREVIVDRYANRVNHSYPIFPHPKGLEFVDFDEDQTIADLTESVAEGFEHPELAKRYSTVAMGPSQGRLSATNAYRIVCEAASFPEISRYITTQRPPFRPIALGDLAGRRFEPMRRTPIHEWHVENRAIMTATGDWQRPAYYQSHTDRRNCIDNEVASIRTAVGLIDVSTLGGIDIRGPDAAELLDRLYTFSYVKQPIGRIRYGLMTDETGAIVDDGVVFRLTNDHFYVTTTTTGSDYVYRTMLKRCNEWQLEVEVDNVTSMFSGINVAGPNSRDVIVKLGTNIDVAKVAFPFLSGRCGDVNGIPVRAMRVGFVGELGYELHVPASETLKLWTKLLDVGREFGIRPVGIDAQRILRLEKGHIIVGQDTDGLTTPMEASMTWAVSHGKPKFVGRAAIRALGSKKGGRRLAGFELQEASGPSPEENNLVIHKDRISGRVTSITRSPTLNKTLGLAYVPIDLSEPGNTISIKCTNGRHRMATIVKTPFFDPTGARQDL